VDGCDVTVADFECVFGKVLTDCVAFQLMKLALFVKSVNQDGHKNVTCHRR